MIMGLMVGVVMRVGVEVVQEGMVFMAVEEAMVVEMCNQKQAVTMIMGDLHNSGVSQYTFVW